MNNITRLNKYSFSFLTAFACLMLLAACNNFLNPGEIQSPAEKGYGRVSITFTGGAARTLLPPKVFSKYVYTFTKAGETTGSEKTPDANGFFLLEIGNYTVQVQAFIGEAEPYILAANGSGEFKVIQGNNDPVRVDLSGVTTEAKGTFGYNIRYPDGAAADITLEKFPGFEAVNLAPVTGGNEIAEMLELEAGSYLLTVRIDKNWHYAGTIEAVHIYPSLLTEYKKDFNDQDLLAEPRSITITGLGDYNGMKMQLGLFQSESDFENYFGSENGTPEIFGEGTVENGTVTVQLLDNDGPWTRSGSWYTGFMIESNNNAAGMEIRFSNAAVNFKTAYAVKAFSDFGKYPFPVDINALAAEMGVEIPSEMTMDDFISFFSEGDLLNYDEFKTAMLIGIYTGKNMTTEVTGDETIAGKTFYMELPLEVLMNTDVENDGEIIGYITGSITLIDIPSVLPKVKIEVFPNYSAHSRSRTTVNLKGLSGTQTHNWKIPVYDDFSPGDVYFHLNLKYDSIKDSEAYIDIGTFSITDKDQEVGDLGTFSIKTIILSGTLDVTYQGVPVPYVTIEAGFPVSMASGQVKLNNPGPNTEWSMLFPELNSETDVSFWVSLYTDDSRDNCFHRFYLPDFIKVCDQNVSGINISLQEP